MTDSGFTYERPDPAAGIRFGYWVHADCQHEEVPLADDTIVESSYPEPGLVRHQHRVTCSECEATFTYTEDDIDADFDSAQYRADREGWT